MYGYIYKTTDLKTNKIYVGKKHSKVFLENYYGSGLIIKNIINKYPNDIKQRFKVELIDTAESLKELNEKEIFWIDFLDSRNSNVGYNIRKGGDCGPGGPMFKGHKHSDETKKKMSMSRRGTNNSNYGNHWNQSDELKLLHSKLSLGENNPMYGKHQSKESKEKSRKSHLGKIAISNIEKDVVKMIYPNELDNYLDNGWIKGNIHAINYQGATTIENR